MAMNSNNTTENTEQDKKKKQSDLRYEFLKDYVRENNTPSVVSIISKSNKIDKTTLDAMDKFKALNRAKYGDLELNSINTSDGINIHALKNAYANDIIKFKTAKNLLFSQIKKTYSIDDNELIKIIESYLESEGSTIKDLYDLINNPGKLEVFVKNNLPKIEKIKTIELFSSIKLLNNDEVKSRFNKNLSEENKNEFKEILSRISIDNIRSDDIMGLFQFNFLTSTEKKNIIDVYMPVISLGKAKDIKIISESEAKQIRKDIMTESFNSLFNDVDFDESVLDSLINNTSYHDIILKSKDLYNNIPSNISDEEKTKLLNKNLNKLAEGIGFKNLEKDFDALKQKVQEKIKQKGPKNFDDLRVGLEQIDSTGRLGGLEKFKKGGIIKYITKNSNNEEVITYLQISGFSDDNKEFYIKNIGDNKSISFDYEDKESKKYKYGEFLEGLKNNKEIRFECFTEDDIKKKIKDKDLILMDYDKLSKNNFDDETNNSYFQALEEDIQNLENEITSTKDENLKKQRELLLGQKKSNLELFADGRNLEVVNKLRFIEKLDGIDPKGKNIGFDKGIYFQIGERIYEIVMFDDDNIVLKNTVSNLQEPPIDFQNFFDQFKKQKAKRIEKIESFDNLISRSLNDSNNKSYKNWENHEFSNGELIAKGVEYGGEKQDKNVGYLISNKNNDIIKINNISGNFVTIQYGERRGYDDLDETEKNKSKIGDDDKGEMVYLDDREETITLNHLEDLIKNDDLYPDWKTGIQIDPEPIQDDNSEFHNSLISKFFRGTSFKEIMMGGKMLIDGIEEVLKKGNSLHAAEFALKLGKMIPGDISEDMLIMVERAQQEQQDKELESLGKIDSWMAIERIEKWLLNKDTPEYKKEAAILFMLDGYGHLTSKRALHKYRGKWLWYQALGGKVGDKLFQDKKAEAEASNITFSEEYLVHILLKQQCSGRMKPKRRSRLHKEYEHKWKSGVNDEFEKGYGDAEKKRTAKDINKGGHDEASSGTTSNAIGWYKKAVERGGSLEEMSEGFFALLFSGALFDVDQATFLKIKALWEADGSPIIMTRFSTTKSDMQLFNNTVVEISSFIEDNYGDEHKGIYDEAKKLRDDALNGTGEESKRYERALDFWKKHGTPVVRALNMADVDDNKYSKTNKVVILERENNPILKSYFNNVRNYTSLDGTFGQGFMDEDCGEVGVTGLNNFELVKKYLFLDTTLTFRHKTTGPRVWDQISNDIKSINSKKFDEDPEIDRQKKEEYLIFKLKDITSGIFSIVGEKRVSPYNDHTQNIGQDFNSWGLNLSRDLGGFSVRDIQKGKADKVLKKVADKIISGNTNDDFSPLDDLIASTKNSATENIVPDFY